MKGRLYKVETNNDSDTAAEVEETFAYDIYGNVVNKTAKVLDYNASSYGIAYEYDHGGNVTRMTYIPASLVLQNETVTGVISYSAVDSITAGPSYTVASGASAVLQAGKKIILKPGFTAQQGSYFNAKIDPFLTTDATVVTYSYDALRRLVSVGTQSDADFYAAYSYLADSRLYSEALVNGTETRLHFYNSPGWLLRIDGDRFTEDITHTTGWSGATGYFDGRIKTTSFTYNWAGKPADYAVQYTYDDIGQLTSADNNLNNAWDIGIGNTITYDANGNILDLRRGSTTKTYSYYTGTNKVQNIDGSGNDYVYDSNANVTSSSPKGINTIAYDTFTQRPVSVSMSSGASLTLEYGGDTQRVLKNYNSGGSTNSRLYLHGANDYPLIEKNKTSTTAETLAVYIYGLNGAVAKRMGSTVLFLLKDHLGSTRVVMDATGLVRTYYDYDALGNLIRTGTVNEVKYQFTGQEYDESGVHNYRARLYDSDLGKFYAVDPAGQGWSPFAYAGNNPVIMVDPDGQIFWAPIIVGAIVGGYFGAVQADMSDRPWYQGVLKGAFVGAVGGTLANFGGGTFLNNVLWGTAEGALTGGLNAALYKQDIGRGLIRGAAWGAAFATVTSGIEATRNEIEDYGFKTNEGVIKDLRNEMINSSAVATRPANANRTIDFVQKRYGMQSVNMAYDPTIHDYGITDLNTGNVRIGASVFNSTSELKATIVHEYAHSVLDRAMIGGRWQWVSPTQAWNYNDGIIGYGAEIVNSGRLHIGYSTLAGTFPNSTNYMNPYWHRFGSKKWWHLIPRRF